MEEQKSKKVFRVLVYMFQKVSGCQLYRQWAPHCTLNEMDDFEVMFTNQLERMKDEELKSFDIIQFHKTLFHIKQFERIKNLGIKTMVDFDDYWRLPKNHYQYAEYKKEDSTRMFIKMLETFDYVTCTTLLLAKEIRKYNKNVFVFANAIPPDIPAYKIQRPFDKPIDGKVRFGWIGGTCHLPDIALLKKLPHKLFWSYDTKDKYLLQIFGYHPGSIFDVYAQLLSGGEKYHDALELIAAKDAFNYTQFYNHTDVCIIPLAEDKFNSMKSELKVIEAGFFKKPIICSNVEPYKGLLKHKKNALVVNRPKDWFRHIRTLIKEPQMREDLGNALYETVKDNYHLNNVTMSRAEVYRGIIGK